MPDYIRLTDEKDIPWFLDHVVVNDIKKTIDAGAGYLAFGLIAQAIEVLGALLDEQEIHVNKPGVPETRFGLAIDLVFEPINKDYARHNKTTSPYYLYEHLRCGMAHVLVPKAPLIFTGRHDALVMGFRHLQEFNPGTADAQLLLVIEDFHDDLAAACARAKKLIKKKTHPKLKQGYITVTNYQYSFLNEGEARQLEWKTGLKLNVTSNEPAGGLLMTAALTGVAPAAQTWPTSSVD